MLRAAQIGLAASLFLSLVASSLFAQPQSERRPPQRSPFERLFTLPGVTFDEKQQTQVDELKQKYLPQLEELRDRQNDIYTREQRQALQQALREAREAGKSPRDIPQIADEALQPTAEQRAAMAQLRQDREDLSGKLLADLRELLTDDQRQNMRRNSRNDAQRRSPRGPAIPPTHADVKYGPYDRNVMDVWLAKSNRPTPVLVSIHGGGFRNGNKSVNGDLLKQALDSGISVVAITYRLTGEIIAPAQHHDCARAIQFIRHQAKQWNLDPTRMAATGGSAGAGLSLWLGFHDDMADPDNEDPVLRESTRLSCMSVYNGQSSYDPRFIRKLYPELDVYRESALQQLYDADLSQLDNLPAEKYRLFEEVSALPHLTKDDAPAALFYASTLETPVTSHGIGIHHPRFGKVLKEEMDKLGIECELHTGIQRGEEWTRLELEFIKRHLQVD